MKREISPNSLGFLVGDTRFELVTSTLSMRIYFLYLYANLDNLCVLAYPNRSLLPIFPLIFNWWGHCGDIICLSYASFHNERNEITEGAISNIFVRKDGIYYTPPVSCGLLRGVYRQYFIETKPKLIREKIIKRQDLYEADGIYLTNAVRGMTRVRYKEVKNKQ